MRASEASVPFPVVTMDTAGADAALLLAGRVTGAITLAALLARVLGS